MHDLHVTSLPPCWRSFLLVLAGQYKCGGAKCVLRKARVQRVLEQANSLGSHPSYRALSFQISEFSAVPVALGGDATFKVSVTGTPPVYIRAVFDDGSQRRWTIFHDPWTFRFDRRYTETGSKHASLKASNAASWTSASAVVVVQEPVSGLSVRLLSPTSPVPLLREVVVEATVESGTGLKFRWDFGEGEMHEQDTQVQR